jgi:hypothetical protein
MSCHDISIATDSTLDRLFLKELFMNGLKFLYRSVLLPLALSCLLLTSETGSADVTNWDNNPMNYENSEMNYENSPLNYNNSPMNYQNNPMNYNSNRIIRDNSGHAMGYEVPKPDGGVNYFDLSGHRKGYQGPGSRW